jgi:hypothetical protein
MKEKESMPDTALTQPEVKQVGWECRSCLDVFTRPAFRWDYDCNQNAAVCPCCGVYL